MKFPIKLDVEGKLTTALSRSQLDSPSMEYEVRKGLRLEEHIRNICKGLSLLGLPIQDSADAFALRVVPLVSTVQSSSSASLDQLQRSVSSSNVLSSPTTTSSASASASSSSSVAASPTPATSLNDSETPSSPFLTRYPSASVTGGSVVNTAAYKMPTWFYLTDAEPIEQQLKNAKRSALVVCLSPEIRAQRLQKLLDSLSRKIREISGATLDAEFGDLVDSSADTSSSMSISSELRSSSPREIRGKDDSSTATNTSTSSSPSTPLTPTKVEYAAGSNDSPRPQSDGATATSAPSPSSSSPSAAAPSTVSSTSSLESALDSGANVVVAAAAAVVAPSASPSVLVKTPSIPLDRISQRPSSDATLSQLKDLMFSLRTQLSDTRFHASFVADGGIKQLVSVLPILKGNSVGYALSALREAISSCDGIRSLYDHLKSTNSGDSLLKLLFLKQVSVCRSLLDLLAILCNYNASATFDIIHNSTLQQLADTQVRSTLYARIIELVGSHDIDTRLNAVKLLYALLMAAGVYEPELRSIWSRHELTRRLREASVIQDASLNSHLFTFLKQWVDDSGRQALEGRILELEQEVIELEAALGHKSTDRLEAAVSSAVAQVRDEMTKQVTELKIRAERAEEMNKTLRLMSGVGANQAEMVTTLEAKNRELEQRVREMQAANAAATALKQQLETERQLRLAAQEQVAALTYQTQGLTSQLELATQSLQDAKTCSEREIQQLTQEHSSLKKQLDALWKRYERAIVANKAASSDDDDNNDHDGLNDDELTPERADSLRREITALRAELLMLEIDKHKIELTVNQLRLQREQVETERAQVEQLREAVLQQRSLSESAVFELNAQRTRLEQEVEQLTRERHQLKTETDDLRKQRVDFVVRIQQLQQQHPSLLASTPTDAAPLPPTSSPTPPRAAPSSASDAGDEELRAKVVRLEKMVLTTLTQKTTAQQQLSQVTEKLNRASQRIVDLGGDASCI